MPTKKKTIESFDLSILKPAAKVITLPVSKKEVRIQMPTVKEARDIENNKKTAEKYKSLNAFVDGCTIEELGVADAEYLTLHIYSESTKSTWSIMTECMNNNCDEQNIEVEYDIKDIEISKAPDTIFEYKAADIIFELRNPTYIELTYAKENEYSILDLCSQLITKVTHNGTDFILEDEQRIPFIDNLPHYISEQLCIFIQDQSHIMVDIEIECEKCGSKGTNTFRRAQMLLI